MRGLDRLTAWRKCIVGVIHVLQSPQNEVVGFDMRLFLGANLPPARHRLTVIDAGLNGSQSHQVTAGNLDFWQWPEFGVYGRRSNGNYRSSISWPLYVKISSLLVDLYVSTYG